MKIRIGETENFDTEKRWAMSECKFWCEDGAARESVGASGDVCSVNLAYEVGGKTHAWCYGNEVLTGYVRCDLGENSEELK